MDQQQTENATNAARGWLYAEICDVSESTCEIERHFYATLRRGRGIQRKEEEEEEKKKKKKKKKKTRVL